MVGTCEWAAPCKLVSYSISLSIHRSTLAVVSINSLERDGLRQAEFCPCYIMDNRPSVGFLVHKDMGVQSWVADQSPADLSQSA